MVIFIVQTFIGLGTENIDGTSFDVGGRSGSGRRGELGERKAAKDDENAEGLEFSIPMVVVGPSEYFHHVILVWTS